MNTLRTITVMSLGLLLAAGCPAKGGGEDSAESVTPEEGPAPGPAPGVEPEVEPEVEQDAGGEPAERPSLTNAECEAQGGTVVGDIGNGAIHRPDYLCDSGQPPLATVVPGEGEPIPTEGAVCCPGAA
ncbi:MAG: hypothetical protein AB1Z98_19305 [Nannocystaceae bacterium]